MRAIAAWAVAVMTFVVTGAAVLAYRQQDTPDIELVSFTETELPAATARQVQIWLAHHDQRIVQFFSRTTENGRIVRERLWSREHPGHITERAIPRCRQETEPFSSAFASVDDMLTDIFGPPARPADAVVVSDAVWQIRRGPATIRVTETSPGQVDRRVEVIGPSGKTAAVITEGRIGSTRSMGDWAGDCRAEG